MKKILFMIGSLDGGGAEKVLLELVRNLNKDKYAITVMPFWYEGVYLEEIKKYVKLKKMLPGSSEEKKIGKYYKRFFMHVIRHLSPKILYRIFVRERYDVEIAFIEGVPTKIISGSFRENVKKYAWVHIDLEKQPYSTFCYKNIENEKKAYAKFDDVYCVSSQCKKTFEKIYGHKALIQNNVLDEQVIIKKAEEEPDFLFEKGYVNLVSVGRLENQKGYERLVNVVAELGEQKLRIYILGEGTQRERLEKLIQEKNLQNQIFLVGFKKNPYPYMKQSDGFVCSSYTEGFSTVATEAIILGLPVITTDCAGMSDLLGNSEFGFIVENSEKGLKDGLKKFMEPSVRKYYGGKAVERSAYYKMEKRIQEMEHILDGKSNLL